MLLQSILINKKIPPSFPIHWELFLKKYNYNKSAIHFEVSTE